MRYFGYLELLFLLAFVPVLVLIVRAVRSGGPYITATESRTDEKDGDDA